MAAACESCLIILLSFILPIINSHDLTHLPPVAAKDIPVICAFPRDEEELFFMFPKANWPLTPAQLQASIDSRADSTVVEEAGSVLGFANFINGKLVVYAQLAT